MKPPFVPSADCLIITPNQRLARILKSTSTPQPASSWETTPVLAYDHFLKKIWHTHTESNLHENRQLLSSEQTEALWAHITQQSNAPSHARLALQTWKLLKNWSLSFQNPALSTSTAGRYFLEWAKLFTNECKKNYWIDETSLAKIICEEPALQQKIKQKTIILFHFIEYTPAQKSLWAALSANGFTIKEIHSKKIGQSAYQLELHNEQEEIRTIARWAKALVDSGETSIACIFPELQEQRETILSVFEEIFEGLPTLHNTHIHSPYNISAGLPLKNYPLIQETFFLLTLVQETFSISTINSLLKSPLLRGAHDEIASRCQLYELLCRDNLLEVNFEKLLAYTNSDHPEKECGGSRLEEFEEICNITSKNVSKKKPSLTLLHQILSTFKTTLNDIQSKKLTPSAWAPIISGLLKTLGWPGDHALSSAEYQLTNRFLTLLNELASFDILEKKISLTQALQRLQQLATNTIFQFQTKQHDVEILGVLEASGLQFQHAWVANMSERVWPPIAKPNPLLPKKFQRDHEMPHSSPQRELEFCEQLTKHFQENTVHIIFSHTKFRDHREHHPSSLIDHLPKLSVQDLKLSPDHSLINKIFEHRELESFSDEHGLPLTPPAVSPGFSFQGPSELLASMLITPPKKYNNPLPTASELDSSSVHPAHGGTSLFKDQASCPFKAYTHHRLQAKSFELPQPGLTAAQRGSIVHKILELLWGTLESQEKLLSYAHKDLENLVDRHIKNVLHTIVNPNSQFFILEQNRLKSLIHSWLELEKNRDPFVVTGREVPITTTINGITINMRADRIDTLDDGNTIIIDYKTNQPSIQSWFGNRPDEPQLPLYCISSTINTGSKDAGIIKTRDGRPREKFHRDGSGEPKAIAFGQINTIHPTYKGVSSQDIHLPEIKSINQLKLPNNPTWQQQVEQWKTTFTRIAQEYKEGLATVTPKSTHTSCTHCDLHALCRIHEHGDIIDE